MTSAPAKGLLDTSVFIAHESGRPLTTALLPDYQAGVLVASDTTVRARRLATLETTFDIEVLPIDSDVAAQWARLRVHLALMGRRINVNDLWIAAPASRTTSR